jgi:2-C-methyl-D-erythritol 2,4-cyclodiphosphate synthase
VRIGNGFDIHRLVVGPPLILGGVRIEYECGLEGHSDGDALTHAITNALLGAACLGDLGIHFPSSDPWFKGVNSQVLLKKVSGMVTEAGYRIINIDSMIICEKPRLSHFYAQMRTVLSESLGIEINCVSVKATTSEGLGTIGNGLAIAAQAVVLIDNL